MDRVKAPAALYLEYDLTPILAYGTAAAVFLIGMALLLGVVIGVVIMSKVERKLMEKQG